MPVRSAAPLKNPRPAAPAWLADISPPAPRLYLLWALLCSLIVVFASSWRASSISAAVQFRKSSSISADLTAKFTLNSKPSPFSVTHSWPNEADSMSSYPSVGLFVGVRSHTDAIRWSSGCGFLNARSTTSSGASSAGCGSSRGATARRSRFMVALDSSTGTCAPHITRLQQKRGRPLRGTAVSWGGNRGRAGISAARGAPMTHQPSISTEARRRIPQSCT